MRREPFDRIHRVAAGARNFHAAGLLQHALKTPDSERLVIENERPHHASTRFRGMERVTIAPPFSPEIRSEASSANTLARRARRLSRPCPSCISLAENPGPSSETSTRNRSSTVRATIQISPPARLREMACLTL